MSLSLRWSLAGWRGVPSAGRHHHAQRVQRVTIQHPAADAVEEPRVPVDAGGRGVSHGAPQPGGTERGQQGLQQAEGSEGPVRPAVLLDDGVARGQHAVDEDGALGGERRVGSRRLLPQRHAVHGRRQQPPPALAQHEDALARPHAAGEQRPAAAGAPRLRLVLLGGHEEEVGGRQQQPGPGLPGLDDVEELVGAVLAVQEGEEVAVEQTAFGVGHQHPVPRPQVLHQLGPTFLQVHRGRAREATTGFGCH